MTPDAHLDLEFTWTHWHDSCRNLYTLGQCCRRPRGHDDEHAAGFGAGRVRWEE